MVFKTSIIVLIIVPELSRSPLLKRFTSNSREYSTYLLKYASSIYWDVCIYQEKVQVAMRALIGLNFFDW